MKQFDNDVDKHTSTENGRYRSSGKWMRTAISKTKD